MNDLDQQISQTKQITDLQSLLFPLAFQASGVWGHSFNYTYRQDMASASEPILGLPKYRICTTLSKGSFSHTFISFARLWLLYSVFILGSSTHYDLETIIIPEDSG